MAGLRKVDVRDDLLRKLGIESVGSASASMLADVLEAMNHAQQMLWMAGPADYFTRSQIALTLVNGTSEYTLADTVQSVLGPLRLPSGRTLRALESRAELDNFGLLYLGQTSATVAAGTPLAYFVETLFQAGNDPVQIKIHVVPAPNSGAAGAATLDGVTECTRFVDSADIAGSGVLPVAQQYSESLFLPIARKALTRSTYFSATQLREQIEADYAEAMAVLGRAGGYQPADKSEKREDAA